MHAAVSTRAEATRELARRVRADYEEMPGLSVTLAQGQRLWSADVRDCEAVVESLVAMRYLRVTTQGRYIRRR
jgi:hypothetical protein